jgi:predicted lipoprotein with Yx(FWY)xxD motif
MKKGSTMLIGIVIVIVVLAGGYAIFHKSNKTTTTSSTTPAATSSPSSPSPAAAVNNAVLATKSATSVGQYLADPAGNALYTYGGDTSGVSNCTGACVANWPAYQDTGATTGLPTNVSTIKRSDNGETQFTYKGMPLYTFKSDSQGQVTGDGVANFKVAKP